MGKVVIACLFISVCLSSFSQADEKIRYRKLDYNDFNELSINDTTKAVIDIFFDKSNNTAMGQMSFLPITVAIYFISQPIGVGLTAVSLPLFLNGSYMLIKYRKKKLYTILVDYKETQEFPKWVRKKAKKQLDFYEEIKLNY